ncbi:MAG: AAA family ATPase [Ruminococcus sp.]|nr:AAA family ATPase [Ruminococcus sp.]
MSIKINTLEFENVKRIKAVKLEPTATGLTIIGGKNNQGKTSVLDAIAWALGGDKYKPTSAARDGAYTDPMLRVELSNGLIIERKGKNSSLKVIDPDGNRSGQQLLNTFISAFALDLPKFMNASDREKADILLQIIGVGDQLSALETEESRLYNQRTAVGRIADQKKKYASELVHWEGVPETPVSASELITKQQEILLKNADHQRKRQNLHELEDAYERTKRQQCEIMMKMKQLEDDLAVARSEASDLQDESTAELENNIASIDALNAKIRDNLNKEQAEDEAKQYEDEYIGLTAQITDLRQQKQDLLQNANLPLPQLTVENGKLLYKSRQWDSMSGSDQLKAATAIVRCLNPDCGFVLLDKLEQMDLDTLREFGEWLTAEGLQAIATRVSTGDECSIIIEDGCVNSANTADTASPVPTWKTGVF